MVALAGGCLLCHAEKILFFYRRPREVQQPHGAQVTYPRSHSWLTARANFKLTQNYDVIASDVVARSTCNAFIRIESTFFLPETWVGAITHQPSSCFLDFLFKSILYILPD